MKAVIQRTVLGVLVAAGVFTALPALAAPLSDLHIASDGTFSATNVLVYQVSGTVLYCRGTWGNAFVRLTVLTTPDLVPALILRNHGGTTTIDEIRQGDLVSITGSLVPAADSLQINAKRVVDFNLNKEQKTLVGTIQSVNAAAGSFVLPNKMFGATTTVLVGTSTIQKGVRTITPAELAAKDKVLSATGTYDYGTNTFAATGLTIYQDPSVFYPRNFQGTVTAISGSTLPVTLTVSTAGQDYLVYLSAGAKVLSKNFAPTQLSRVQVGDMVRLYGSIHQDNLANLDATILRDLNF
jgi:hypothetical protein